MMHVFFTAVSSLVAQRGGGVLFPVVPLDAYRVGGSPYAKLITFNAKRTVFSEPFEATDAGLREWFGTAESVVALCSMADSFRKLAHDRVESAQSGSLKVPSASHHETDRPETFVARLPRP